MVLVVDSLGSGGAQRQIVALFNTLRARGRDVFLVYYHPLEHFLPEVDAREPARIVRLPTPRPTPFPTILALRRLLQRLRPDTVLTFLTGCTLLTAAARLGAPRFRWIVSERNSELKAWNKPSRLALYLRAIRRADLVTANSHAALDELRASGVRPERLAYVPNGITVDRIPAAPPERPAPPLRLLMVGSMRPGKNHVGAVQALAGLGDLPWELDIVGRDDEFPDLRERVVALAREAGLADRVRLHGARTDVDAFYAQAHLVLQPSLYEGFPNVLLEAWAWRCAVLVSDRGDLPRLVTDGQDGLVAPIVPTEALRDAIAAALADPPRLAALGEAGHATLRATYTFDAVADRWWAVLTGAR